MNREVEIVEQFLKAYDDLSDAIFRHCWFKIGDRERAKDLMQEVFTKSWKYIVEGAEIKNLRPFLYKVANNLIIDEYRKKRELSLESLSNEGFEPADNSFKKDVEISIDAKLAVNLINKLNPKYKEIILMRYVDDLSPGDIAEITGESKNNISVKIHRGVKELKEIIRLNNKK